MTVTRAGREAVPDVACPNATGSSVSPKISYLDFKHLEMDRVLTAFFARLAHNGYPSRLRRKVELTVEAFVDEFLEHPEWFTGFAGAPRRPRALGRDAPPGRREPRQVEPGGRRAAAAARVHATASATRSTRATTAPRSTCTRCSTTRATAPGRRRSSTSTHFFFQGHDKVTGQGRTTPRCSTSRRRRCCGCSIRSRTPPDTKSGREKRSAALRRRRGPPRRGHPASAVLPALHPALGDGRLPEGPHRLPPRRSTTCACSSCCRRWFGARAPIRRARRLRARWTAKSSDNPHGDCPYRIGLLVDVAGQPGTPMADLAERSADTHYRRIPTFVRAYFATKKLDEFATDLVRRGKLPKPTERRVLGRRGAAAPRAGPRRPSARSSSASASRASWRTPSGATDAELDPELKAVTRDGPPEFETYIEMLVALRGPLPPPVHHASASTRCC